MFFDNKDRKVFLFIDICNFILYNYKGDDMIKKYLEICSNIIVLIVFTVVSYFNVTNYITIKNENEHKEKVDKIISTKEQEISTINLIKSHYDEAVIVQKDTKIFDFKDNKYEESGTIYKDTIVYLDSSNEINAKTKYFKLENIDSYIEYQKVTPVDSNYIKDDDYKNYIPFDENVTTDKITNLYSENDELAFSLNVGVDRPLIIKDEKKYYIEYAGNLYYVKSDEAVLKKTRTNTEALASNIATLAYHFFYDASKGNDCNQIICLSNTKFDEQMKYLKDNNYYTATMKAFELWIDKKIRLPQHTVVLTIDDGYRQEAGIEVLEKYDLHATLFLVTSWNKPDKYKTNVYEYHSHSHDMHNTGDCPNGQGGGIQCLPKATIINDLKTSQNILNGTSVFCYPFYEYNEYSISVLKEAGYTMAFGGLRVKTHQGYNKYKLPRYTILDSDTLADFISYIK